MAYFLSAIACPHCGCCSTEDDYNKLGEKFIWCFRCGYYYQKTVRLNDSGERVYSEKEYKDFGTLQQHKKQEEGSEIIFHYHRLSSEENPIIYVISSEKVLIWKKVILSCLRTGSLQYLLGIPKRLLYPI